MKTIYFAIRRTVLPLAVVLMPLLFGGCSSALTKVPLFKVTIQVVDVDDQPIKGAIVESSNGQQTTTDAGGTAQVRLASMGVNMVSIWAEGLAPVVLSIVMPVDMGKTFTARLGQPIDISASINVNITGMMTTALYPMLFQALFTAQGYSMELVPYGPGEWTEWDHRADEDVTAMKKAYLTKLGNGQEWWQMRMAGGDADDTIIMEVLFNQGRDSIRRLRQQTGSGEPSEVPVTEGWYTPPMELTSESMAGAVTERGVSVKVPAGSFKADLLEFALYGGAGTLRLWQAKGVPGGVVKAEMVDDNGDVSWASELKGHGKGAKTALNSY